MKEIKKKEIEPKKGHINRQSDTKKNTDTDEQTNKQINENKGWQFNLRIAPLSEAPCVHFQIR